MKNLTITTEDQMPEGAQKTTLMAAYLLASINEEPQQKELPPSPRVDLTHRPCEAGMA
ncbi:MAG TPA: hypothetical protein PKI93_02175 [Alphaproteobacteria bacterium]|nr:hypothetical protein [Alphaproteobacteria bacterium]HNS44125.1 hypothetical protein [Alphaproteobacteria bacterium]